MDRRILLAAAAVAGLSAAAFAGPYAAGVTETAGTVSFYLNSDADEVVVIRDGVSESLGGRGRGQHTFARNGAGVYEIVVKRNTFEGYHNAFDQNISIPNQLTDDNTLLQFDRPNGIAINRNPMAGANFGRVYILQPRVFTTGSGRTVNDGLYLVNPDLSTEAIPGQGDAALTGGIAWELFSSTGGVDAVSPWRLDIDRDGFIYVGDWSNPRGGVYRLNPDVGTSGGTNLFAGTAGTFSVSPFTPTNALNHSAVGGLAVSGTAAAGNLKVYTLDEYLTPALPAAGPPNGLWTYDVGSTTSNYDAIPTAGVSPLIPVGGVVVSLARGENDGKLYLSQNRSDGNEDGVIVASPDGQTILWRSLTDSRLLGLDGNAGVDGVQDVLRQTWDLTVSPDGRWLGVGVSSGGDGRAVPLIEGIPDIANRLTFDAFAGGTTRSAEFDLAGNLYHGNSTDELVRAFAPGGYSETTWSSAGTFSARNEPDFNGSGNFSDGSRWLGGSVPGGADAFAVVGNLSSGAQTLTLDNGVEISRIRFAGGDYTVNGSATLTMGNGFNEPRLIVEQGDVTISAPVQFNKNPGVAAYTGQSLTLTNVSLASGTFIIQKFGGGLVTMPLVQQADLLVLRDGTLRFAAANGTTQVKRLAFGVDGRLDLTDNDLILDYEPAPVEASPELDAVKAAIASAYAGGTWSGPGLTSSLADGANNGLGYAEASDLGLTTFNGIAVDATTVVVKYTFFGDTNLDGQVDVTDLGNLATNWQLAGDWIAGDSNYDGLIDVADLGALATNWQAGVTGPLAPDASLHQALIGAGLGSVVPEPASLSLLALGALALRRRK